MIDPDELKRFPKPEDMTEDDYWKARKVNRALTNEVVNNELDKMDANSILHATLHVIAYDPIGPPEATDGEVLNHIVKIARIALDEVARTAV